MLVKLMFLLMFASGIATIVGFLFGILGGSKGFMQFGKMSAVVTAVLFVLLKWGDVHRPTAKEAEPDAVVAEAQKVSADAAAQANGQPVEAAAPAAADKPPEEVRIWVIPSGRYGYFVDNHNVVDATKVYLPGNHARRPNGKLRLVDASVSTTGFGVGEGSVDSEKIQVMTIDAKNVNVNMTVSWTIDPEMLPYIKSRFGENYRYTPEVINIVRAAVRDAGAMTYADGTSASGAGGIWINDRVKFNELVIARIRKMTHDHYAGLGVPKPDQVISYGAVSIRSFS